MGIVFLEVRCVGRIHPCGIGACADMDDYKAHGRGKGLLPGAVTVLPSICVRAVKYYRQQPGKPQDL